MKTGDSSLEFQSTKESPGELPLIRDEEIDGFESVDLKKSKERPRSEDDNEWVADMDETPPPVGITNVSFAPFQCLIHEQAKSIVALQELQHDVYNLLAFRDAVLSAFPHLSNLMQTSNVPSSQPPQTWTRRRHLQSQQKTFSSDGKETATTSSGAPGVSDSGFNSEAKESSGSTSAASPRSSRWLDYSHTHPAMVHHIAPPGPELKHQLERLRSRIRREEFCSPNRFSRKSTSPIDEKDELWALLDAIENKGIQMKRDLDTFSGKNEPRSRSKERYRISLNGSDDSYERNGTVANGVERQPSYDSKRDLVERITETESRLQTALLDLEKAKKDREYYSYAYSKADAELKTLRSSKTNVESELQQTRERLLAAEQQVKETVQRLNSKSADLVDLREKFNKLQSESTAVKRVDEVSVTVNGSPIFPKKLVRSSAQLNLAELVSSQYLEEEKVTLSSEDVLSVIRERSVVELQRMLLKQMMEFSALKGRLRSKSESTLLEPGEISESQRTAEELVKVKEENDELKFMLEEQKIELEGTKAQLRVSRQLSMKQKRPVTTSVLVQTESPETSLVWTQTATSMCDLVDIGTQTHEKSLSTPPNTIQPLAPLTSPLLALEAAKMPSRIPTPIKSRTSSLVRTRGDCSIGSLTSLGSKGDKRLNSLKNENKGSLDVVKEKPKRDGSLRYEKPEPRPSLEKKSKKRIPSSERLGTKNPSTDGKVMSTSDKRMRTRTASSILELTLDDGDPGDSLSHNIRREPQYYFFGANKLAVFQNRNLFRKSASHEDGLNDRCFSPIIMNNLSRAPRIY